MSTKQAFLVTIASPLINPKLSWGWIQTSKLSCWVQHPNYLLIGLSYVGQCRNSLAKKWWFWQHLCPLAIQHAVWLFNMIPNHGTGLQNFHQDKVWPPHYPACSCMGMSCLNSWSSSPRLVEPDLQKLLDSHLNILPSWQMADTSKQKISVPTCFT